MNRYPLSFLPHICCLCTALCTDRPCVSQAQRKQTAVAATAPSSVATPPSLRPPAALVDEAVRAAMSDERARMQKDDATRYAAFESRVLDRIAEMLNAVAAPAQAARALEPRVQALEVNVFAFFLLCVCCLFRFVCLCRHCCCLLRHVCRFDCGRCRTICHRSVLVSPARRRQRGESSRMQQLREQIQIIRNALEQLLQAGAASAAVR